MKTLLPFAETLQYANVRHRSWWLAVVLAVFAGHAYPRAPKSQTALIGLDHLPLAVVDLDRASDTYRQLGFSLKPGRSHDNSIRNQHIKFPDGSGIELLTASAPRDGLSARYLEFLAQGEGPAFLSFHARDTDKLLAALGDAGFEWKQAAGVVTMNHPQLGFVFFVRDNRSLSDRPEHFTNPNSAHAMTGVWLALDEPEVMEQLLQALGAKAETATVRVPEPVQARIYRVANGRVVLLPASFQRISGRPLVGAEFEVRSLDQAPGIEADADKLPQPPGETAAHRSRRVSPVDAHGIWLEFHQHQ